MDDKSLKIAEEFAQRTAALTDEAEKNLEELDKMYEAAPDEITRICVKAKQDFEGVKRKWLTESAPNYITELSKAVAKAQQEEEIPIFVKKPRKSNKPVSVITENIFGDIDTVRFKYGNKHGTDCVYANIHPKENSDFAYGKYIAFTIFKKRLYVMVSGKKQYFEHEAMISCNHHTLKNGEKVTNTNLRTQIPAKDNIFKTLGIEEGKTYILKFDHDFYVVEEASE